ncbi:MAG: flagellar hook-associated protein 2 [Lysobacteraceae bacterium]|nr:MAG: flagellar hook-associated protein 2 [Xanthomonadaceae bacterium]
MGITSGIGAGSGLDIGGLVSQLVAAERAAPSAALNRREARANAQISALSSLKGAFSALQSAVTAFRSDSLFQARSFSSTQQDYVVAVASGSAAAAIGSFEVVVDRLASAQRIRFNELAEGAPLQEGTLSIQFGPDAEDTLSVDVQAGDTLRQLAAAINAKGKPVSATVVRSDTGESLVLSSGRTGAAYTLSVTQTGGSGDLSFLETANPANFTELAAAQDARAFVDGLEVTGSSNTLSGVVEGVDLVLKKVTDGIDGRPANARISVSESLDALKGALQSFVANYNEARAKLAEATSFDLKTKTAAALNGDAVARNAGIQIQNALSELIAESGKLGIDLGLATDATGKLSFDASKFDSAHAADPAAVRTLLKGEDGVLNQRFAARLDGLLGDEGAFTVRQRALDAQLEEVARQREALDLRMQQVEARYRKQFTALDALVGRLSSTSNFLAQQLASLPKIGAQ